MGQEQENQKWVCNFNSIALNRVKLWQSSVMLLWIHICSDVFSYRVQGPLLCHNFSYLLQTGSHRHTGTCLQWPERSLHYLQPWCCTVCLFPPCEWWQLPLKPKHIINTNIFKRMSQIQRKIQNCTKKTDVPLRPHEIKMGVLWPLFLIYVVLLLHLLLHKFAKTL